MDLGLKGKSVVVTGGSKGIGYAIAQMFLEEGARVAICARDQKQLDEAVSILSAYGEVMGAALDASNDRQMYDFADQVCRRFGSIDCWVNNVGASAQRNGDMYTDDQINWIVDVCFKSAIYGCQAAFRHMKQTGGSIVNISSLAARCGTVGRSTLYGPLKAAVANLATMYAGEYAAYGIRVNAVLPGFTLTPALKRTISSEELHRNAQGTLLQRLAAPEEIAAAVVFLSSSCASYITAATLEVSGGRSVVLNPSYSYERRDVSAHKNTPEKGFQ